MPKSCGCFNIRSLLTKRTTSSDLTTAEQSHSLPFEDIPLDLQLEIVKKMDFEVYVEFSLSSKHAYALHKDDKTRLTLDVGCVLLDPDGIRIPKPFPNKHLSRGYMKWETIQKSPNFPQICVSGNIYIFRDTKDEDLDKIINSGNFFGRNCMLDLHYYENDIAPDVFSKLLDVFNVTTFVNQMDQFNEELLTVPQISKLEYISLSHNVDPRNFSTFRASHIRIGCASPLINHALNQYFKEWFENKRKVKWLSVHLASGEKFDAEIIFSELPVLFLWSIQKHKTSVISHVKVKRHHCSTGIEYFVFERDGEKLWIALDSHLIQVDNVENEKARMLREIEAMKFPYYFLYRT